MTNSPADDWSWQRCANGPLLASSHIGYLTERIAELSALVYVRGERKCASCGFILVSRVLDVAAGAVGIDDADQSCPNGCGPMSRILCRDAYAASFVNGRRAFNNGLERAAISVSAMPGCDEIVARIRELKIPV